MTRLLAILAFALALVFYGWQIAHGTWTWTFFLLLGLLLWCISGSHDKVP